MDNIETERFSSFQPKSLIIFILVVLIIGSIISYSFSRQNKDNNNPVPLPTNAVSTGSSNMIIYGVWKDNKSFIKGYDIESKKEYMLAELPSNIKKVTIISPNKLLYIGDTNGDINGEDHGKNLSVYDLTTKKSTPVVSATANFGIDDYVISKNNKYIATWEVLLDPATNTVYNGKSRIYSADIQSPGNKNLIYDEIADKPIHYPKAITSNGDIFLDTFLPNGGARQWAYGMSVSDFTGVQKRNLDNMANGTYGTQPEISPDEKYLVFSGFNGSAIDGTKKDKSTGMRKAVYAPDTIELLDTKTLARTKLQNLPNENIYDSAIWDTKTGNIITSIPKGINQMGRYYYNLNNPVLRKINFSETNNYVAALSSNNFILGRLINSVSAVGNLGKTYAYTFTQFSFVDNSGNKLTQLNVSDNIMQFIAVFPSSYFQASSSLTESNNDTLQMYAFNLKPSLAPKREKQQTDPPKLSRPTAPPGVPEPDPCDTISPDNPFYDTFCLGIDQGCTDRERERIRQLCANDPNYVQCYDYNMNNNMANCMGTPLYIYGPEGTKVNVKVNSYVYSSNPLYNPEKGYDVKIFNDGKMEVNGNLYDRINYDFIGENVNPPSSGIVTPKEKLKDTLIFYSKNLGLNDKETNDLINYANANIQSPYVFVSFYDEEKSKEILPLEFNPKPDTYINIVFYFKELNNPPLVSLIPPNFPNIPNRTGLTAVEISEVVEK